MKYQNLSRTTRKIHGVTLKPLEIKEIPGVVNDKDLIRVADNKVTKSVTKVSQKQKDESVKQETQPPVQTNKSQEVKEADG